MIVQTVPFQVRCCLLAGLLVVAGGSGLSIGGVASDFEELGRWPGAPWREPKVVHVNGDLAYLGTGQGLMVLDVSDPSRPKYVSHLDCVAGGTTDVYAAGEHVYLAAGPQAMRIVNIADPAVPTLTAELDVSGDFVNAIVVRGDFAFLSYGAGLGRALVNPPDAPLYGGGYLDVAALGRMQIVDGFGYVSTVTGLQIVDLRNVSQPILLGDVGLGAGAKGVAVQGEYAYMPMGDGLHVIDVSDPNQPAEVGVYATSNAVGAVKVVGETAYVCVGTATRSVVQALSLQSPAEPSLRGELEIQGGRPAMDVHLGHVLLVNRFSGVDRMDIVDFTDPGAPVLAAAWENPGTVKDLSVGAGTVLAACGTGGLRVIDTTDGSAPQVVGSYAPAGGASVLRVEQAGTTAGLGGSDAFRLLDVSVPGQPELEGTYWPMMGQVQLMDIVGDRAYLVTGFGMGEFEVLDIAERTAPNLLGGTSVFFDVFDLAVAPNGVAFLAAGWMDLQMFHTSQEGNPTALPSYGGVPGVYALELRTEGEDLLVYLAGQDGLAIVQFNDPAQPQLVGQWVSGGVNLGAVALAGNRAYVANTQQLWAIDITDPTSPSTLAEYPLAASELGAVEDRVYAVTTEALVILQLGGSVVEPQLGYQSQGGALLLDWSGASAGAWVLQSTSDLLNPQGWETVNGSETATEWQPVMDAPWRFFRLAPAAP